VQLEMSWLSMCPMLAKMHMPRIPEPHSLISVLTTCCMHFVDPPIHERVAGAMGPLVLINRVPNAPALQPGQPGPRQAALSFVCVCLCMRSLAMCARLLRSLANPGLDKPPSLDKMGSWSIMVPLYDEDVVFALRGEHLAKVCLDARTVCARVCVCVWVWHVGVRLYIFAFGHVWLCACGCVGGCTREHVVVSAHVCAHRCASFCAHVYVFVRLWVCTCACAPVCVGL